MDVASCLVNARSHGDGLMAAARTAGPDAPVSTCPGWNVARLCGHVGTVTRWQAETVRTQATERIDHRSLPQPPDGAAALDWCEAGLADALAVLEAAEPDAPVWNFTAAPKVAGFWPRRLANELAVHRVDAEGAAGLVPTAVPADQAADAIDEYLSLLIPARLAVRPVEGLAGTVHFHATDVDGEWTVGLRPDGLDVAREHGKGDAAARGRASDLLLFLYNRAGLDGLEVFGDTALLAAWKDRIRL